MSGFLTGYVYKNKEIHLSVSDSKNFLARKLKKFYPLHFVALFLSMILQLLYTIKNFGLDFAKVCDIFVKTILNAIFLQVYIPIDGWYMNGINGVAWFLSSIVYCYLFSIIGLAIIQKMKKLGKIKLLFFFVFIIHLIIFALFKDTKLSTYVLYVFPPYRYLEYFMAMILGYCIKFEESLLKRNKWIASFMEILVIMAFGINHYLIKTGFWGTHGNFRIISMVWISLLLVYIFSFEAGIASGVLNQKWLIVIGNNSFYIYIMHQVIIKYTTTIFGWNNLGATVSVIAIVIYTVLISKYYDKIFGIMERKLAK